MAVKNLSFLFAVLFIAACESASETSRYGDGSMMDEMVLMESQTFSPDPASQDYLDVNIGDRVHFDFDKYSIRGDYVPLLEAQAQWMSQNPSVRVSIGGYCDERGTREYNLALGARRANAVKDFLVAAGVDSSRITTVSYGKEYPAVLGSTEAAYAANRRAVTRVQ